LLTHSLVALLLVFGRLSTSAQSAAPPDAPTETTAQQVERLSAAMTQAAAQVEASQKLLLDLQQQMAVLKLRMAAEAAAGSTAKAPPTSPANASATPSANAPASPSDLEDIREQLAIASSQIATHDQSKVETQSKFPLTVTGLLLFNTFVNTRAVDIPSSPSYVLSGSGSTGFSVRQTILGLDARGPHLFGAISRANLRTDFFASDSSSGYTAGGLLRLRTARAELDWSTTQAYFSLDRTLLEPNAPTSLLAIGQPELAWSGNLWTWNPQAGVSQRISLKGSSAFELQAALIDPSDPLAPGSTATSSNVSSSERSRWPGVEARISWHSRPNPASNPSQDGFAFGAGGYFSPHRTIDGQRYDAWAASLDARVPITRFVELYGSAYRGQALGGLGGSGYVDYLNRYVGYTPIARALDDVGGWAQIHARPSERFEWNAGYGIDNPFAGETEYVSYFGSGYGYQGLARNRTCFTNAIYNPKANLLFSLEYRRLWSNYLGTPTYRGNVIGLGAGYKF
jgi:hypothetical protein